MTADGFLLATAFEIPVGPYDKASLLGSADVAPMDAWFDDLVVHAGDTFAPAIDLDAGVEP